MKTQEIVSLYEKTLIAGNKSPHTIRGYMKDIRKVIDGFSINDVSDVLKLSVSDYVSFYGSLKLSDKSLNGLIRNLSAFFNYFSEVVGVDKKEISFFQVKFGKSRFVKEQKIEVEVLTDQEVRQLISGASNIQEKAMLTLMAYQGFRAGTIAKIKMEDLDTVDGRVKIYLKGNKKVFVSLHNDVIEVLKKFNESRDTSREYLFYNQKGKESGTGSLTTSTVNNRVKSCAKRAGFSEERIKQIHAHGIRHYFGSKMVIEHGIDVAQRALNHANQNTTKIYDHSGSHIQSRAIVNQKSIMFGD